MDPQFANLNTGHDPHLQQLTEFQKDVVLELCRIYTGLEYIATNDSSNLSGTGKMNLRKAQAQIQKTRLKLIDHFLQL